MIFVDENCIGCGMCEGIAGNIFKVEGGLSHVTKQPETEQEINEAKDAISACPVTAIHEGAPTIQMPSQSERLAA